MSNLNVKNYIASAMIGNGFAILNGGIAFKIFPGNWGSAQSAASDFHNEQGRRR